MAAFKNRFWGVRRLRLSKHEEISAEQQQRMIEPYLSWRILALDNDAILLCNAARTGNQLLTKDMVIIEGELMSAWMQHHTGV